MNNLSSLEAIFFATLEKQSAQERAAYLDEACAGDPDCRRRVEKMLAAQAEAGSFLEQPVLTVAATSDEPSATERPGTVIGPYKLLQQIGDGGMGVVWMAEQTHPVERKVAVKVIRPGLESSQVIARFEAERQALAMMDHVNIARVLDAGATESGLPYFVMELVHGVPITKYCDDNHLTPRERLELFVPVCQAIQHAHQKGIIHRDIKPSNVMITHYDGKPVPKVIDFGVAKATEQKLTERTLFTQYGTMVGTLEYMSPEQAEMSALGVDTRSDIYSLGVLLYELLTGSTPLTHKRLKEAAYAEVLRIIKEEDPPRPSTRLSTSGEALASISANRHMEPAKLTRLVRGELDWIVMKTLEKDRNRRYETANDFSADVQRYLNDEQVQACPPTAWYRFRKFARRNKASLATSALVATALVLGIMVSSWQAIRARQAEALAQIQQQQAATNLRKARQAADEFYTRVAQDWLAQQPRLTRAQRDFLERALAFYEDLAQDPSAEPEVRFQTALANQRVGAIRQKFGEQARAKQALDRAILLLQELTAECPEEPLYRTALAGAYNNLGLLLHDTGRSQEAEHAFRQALPLFERAAAESPDDPDRKSDLAGLLNNLANVLSTRGEAAEGHCRLLEKAISLQQAALKVKSKPLYREKLANHHMNLGRVQTSLGQHDKAEVSHRQARNIWNKLVEEFAHLPAYRQGLAKSHINLADLLHPASRYEEAVQEYRQALEQWQRLVADYPDVTNYEDLLAGTLFKLGTALTDAGKYSEAAEVFPKALTRSQSCKDARPETADNWGHLSLCHSNFGRLLARTGQAEEAVTQHRKAIAVRKEMMAKFSATAGYQNELASNYLNLGTALHRLRQYDEEEKAYREALPIMKQLVKEFPLPAYRQDLALILNNLGGVLQILGKLKDSEEIRAEASAIYRKLTDDYPKTPDYRHELARCLDNQGILLRVVRGPKEAVESHREAVALYKKLVEDYPKVPDYRAGLGAAHMGLGLVLSETNQLVQAAPSWREARRLFAQLVAEVPTAPGYRMWLARAHRHLGELPDPPAVREKEYHQARDILKKLLEEFPKEHDYQEELAKTCGKLGSHLYQHRRLPQAEELSREALALWQQVVAAPHPKASYPTALAEFHNLLAIIVRDAGRHQEAVEQFRLALKADPKYAPPYNNLAYLLADCPDEKLRDLGQAVVLAKQAVRLDARGSSYWSTLGLAQYRSGNWDEAAAALQEWVKLEPAGHYAGYLYLAMTHCQLDDPNHGRQWYNKAVAWSEKNKWGLDNNASAREEFQRYRVEAAELLDDPSELGGALNNLALTVGKRGEHALARKLFQDAIRHQKAALKLNGQDAQAQRFLRIHYGNLIAELGLLGELAQLAATAEEMSDAFPKDWQAALNAARDIMKCRDLTAKDTRLAVKERDALVQSLSHRAARQFAEAAKRNPTTPAAQNEIAWRLASWPDAKDRNAPLAVTLAKKAVDKAPGIDSYWHTLGFAHYYAGQWKEAIEAGDKAVQLNKAPDCFDWLLLAMAHGRLGDKDKKARNYYDKALDWEKANPQVFVNSSEAREGFRRFRTEAAELLDKKE